MTAFHRDNISLVTIYLPPCEFCITLPWRHFEQITDDHKFD
jgi:hypothetical protein